METDYFENRGFTYSEIFNCFPVCVTICHHLSVGIC